METLTQTCCGTFKVKAHLKDDGMDRCFHGAAMISDGSSAVSIRAAKSCCLSALLFTECVDCFLDSSLKF